MLEGDSLTIEYDVIDPEGTDVSVELIETPDYVLLTERQSSSTQGMQSYGAPDNMCILFEVRQ